MKWMFCSHPCFFQVWQPRQLCAVQHVKLLFPPLAVPCDRCTGLEWMQGDFQPHLLVREENLGEKNNSNNKITDCPDTQRPYFKLKETVHVTNLDFRFKECSSQSTLGAAPSGSCSLEDTCSSLVGEMMKSVWVIFQHKLACKAKANLPCVNWLFWHLTLLHQAL